MTKLRRFIVPPLLLTLIVLFFLSATASGKLFLFKVTDPLLFTLITDELVVLTMSGGEGLIHVGWLFFTVYFFVWLGVFSLLWGYAVAAALQQTVKQISKSDNAKEEVIELKRNGMSAYQVYDGLLKTTIGHFLMVLFAGTAVVFLAILVIGSVLVVGFLLIIVLINLFVEITPPIETSWFLLLTSLAIGMIYVVVGYAAFSVDPERELEEVLREDRRPEDGF